MVVVDFLGGVWSEVRVVVDVPDDEWSEDDNVPEDGGSPQALAAKTARIAAKLSTCFISRYLPQWGDLWRGIGRIIPILDFVNIAKRN